MEEKSYYRYPDGTDCWDLIQRLTVGYPDRYDAYAGFLVGNVIKYLFRYRLKESDAAVSDLRKAATYLQSLIEWEG